MFSLSIPLSLHFWCLTSPLWPATMNVDRDRRMQGGQQPCLASGSSLWQQISMRADNGTGSENNVFCQARNSACHIWPFPMLRVFLEQRWARKLQLKCSFLFPPSPNSTSHISSLDNENNWPVLRIYKCEMKKCFCFVDGWEDFASLFFNSLVIMWVYTDYLVLH